MADKIGVFICTGYGIGEALDIEALEKTATGECGAAFCRTLRDSGGPGKLSRLGHYFGLRFNASMILLLDPRSARDRLEKEPAALCAHEFFHSWIGELVRQRGYEMNWFVEGVATLWAAMARSTSSPG